MAKKRSHKATAVDQSASGPTTLRQFPLLAIRDARVDQETASSVRFALRPDDVKLSVFNLEHGQILGVVMSAADFRAFVDAGRAHAFDCGWKVGPLFADTTAEETAPSMVEGRLLEIGDKFGSAHNYAEIWLRVDGVVFSVTAKGHGVGAEGRGDAVHEDSVVVSPTDFVALIERCQLHQFDNERK